MARAISISFFVLILRLGRICAESEGIDIWQYDVRLETHDKVASIVNEADTYFRSLGGTVVRLRLIVRAWRSCVWARVIAVTREYLQLQGASLNQLSGIKRCGPNIRFNCHFYNAIDFETTLGVGLRDMDVIGYLVTDSMWEPGVHGECRERESFHSIMHPLRKFHPDGMGHWVFARSRDQGYDLSVDKHPSINNGETYAASFIQDVCTHDGNFNNVWESLWPLTGSPARQMIIIGCGDMTDEPTQLLVDRGVGGLFVDRDRSAIKKARARDRELPRRMIVNRTIDPSNVLSLLRSHATFAQEVDVIQVDIDTVDGPIVQRLLEVTTPKAVVVECREFIPFPFRYAFLATETDGLPWGGATIGYWIYELRLRGYELAKMNTIDAVFIHRSFFKPSDPRRHFLATLACFLRNMLQKPSPAFLLRTRSDIDKDWIRLQHAWMEMPPARAVEEIWRNLTTWRPDLRFFLDT